MVSSGQQPHSTSNPAVDDANMAEKQAKAKNGPIIMLTNLSSDPIITETVQKGAKSYLIKAGLTPDQLLAKVKEELG
jgi:DNA-binding NarL/FixJ family response regulator